MTGCRKKAFAGSAAAHQRGETRRLSLEIDSIERTEAEHKVHATLWICYGVDIYNEYGMAELPAGINLD